jgi:hypothetical protein
VAVFVLVSSQTGFSRYLRYVLPCFPFVFVYIGRVGNVFGTPVGSRGSRVEREVGQKERGTAIKVQRGWGQRFWLKALVGGGLAWSIVSSVSVYPHSMSYFNELAGGPRGGHRYLLDANIDWGQDLWYLKAWYDGHPEARPLHVATMCFVEPRFYGIESQHPAREPRPGWYAMSIHHIRQHGFYEFFLRYEPFEVIGYSIYTYHVSLDEANRVRRDLGLPLLSGEETAEGTSPVR